MADQKEIFNRIYKDDTEEADSITNVNFLKNNINLIEPVLEIGFGKGYVIEYLTNRIMDINGVEISEKAVEYIKQKNKNIKVLLYDGKKLPFNDEAFSIVLSFDVLEHFNSVNGHLSEVFRVLKTNGIYVFQTPNKITNLPKEIIFRGGLKKAREFHPSVQSYFSLKKHLIKNGFNFKFVSMPLISPEKYKALRTRNIGWRISAGILNKLPKNIIPIFLRPNFWVIAKKEL